MDNTVYFYFTFVQLLKQEILILNSCCQVLLMTHACPLQVKWPSLCSSKSKKNKILKKTYNHPLDNSKVKYREETEKWQASPILILEPVFVFYAQEVSCQHIRSCLAIL